MPEFAVKVPLSDQLPLTANVFEPVIDREAPELIVMLLHSAADPIFGANDVPGRIITLVEEVGIMSPHQLVAVCQSLSVIPSQVPVIQLDVPTVKTPDAAAKYVVLI